MKKQVKKLHILGRDYRVITDNLKDDHGFLFGEVDYRKKTICLNNTNDNLQNEETLLHEIIHVISVYLALHLSEKSVTSLSSGLYSVIKDNPNWIKT